MPGIQPTGLSLDFDVQKFVPGSFVEFALSQDGQTVADNSMFKQESYIVNIPSPHIAMPVFFEVRDHKKITRTLIMDMKSKTTYYQFR